MYVKHNSRNIFILSTHLLYVTNQGGNLPINTKTNQYLENEPHKKIIQGVNIAIRSNYMVKKSIYSTLIIEYKTDTYVRVIRTRNENE